MERRTFVIEIEEHMAHQLKWRRVMSIAYFTSAAVGIISSTAATVTAGFGNSYWAALLAGTATVTFGLEKALLFREKWTHHLNNVMQLESLKIQYVHGGMMEADAARELSRILTAYAERLPVAPRQDTE